MAGKRIELGALVHVFRKICMTDRSGGYKEMCHEQMENCLTLCETRS